MNPAVTIVVPVYNKYNYTKACLDDLFKLDNCQIIVVDNGSEDSTEIELAKIKNDNFIYLRLDHNYGFAHACNKGFAEAKAKHVMFLNNDIRVKANYNDWANNLLASYEEDTLLGPTMGQLNDNFEFVREANEYLGGKSYISGWCLFASKNTFNKLILPKHTGPFCEDFFCYFEDTDLSFRAKEKNIQFRVKAVPVVHFGRITSSTLNTTELYRKAKAIFVKKWKIK